MLQQISSLFLFCLKLKKYLNLLQSLCLFYNMSYCILLFFSFNFISAAIILLAFLALKVQFLIRYNRARRASEDLICKIQMSLKGKSTYQYNIYLEDDLGNL
jgi:hypothetical protein